MKQATALLKDTQWGSIEEMQECSSLLRSDDIREQKEGAWMHKQAQERYSQAVVELERDYAFRRVEDAARRNEVSLAWQTEKEIFEGIHVIAALDAFLEESSE